MSSPDFSHEIQAALAAKNAKIRDLRQSLADEAKRQELNLDLVRRTLGDIVLPVFRTAADQLRDAGCYAEVQEVRSEVSKEHAVILFASLHAGHKTSSPPQPRVELRYQGEPVALAFTLRLDGQSRPITLDDITPEHVKHRVAELILRMP